MGLGLGALIIFLMIAMFALLFGGDSAVTPPVVTVPGDDALTDLVGDSAKHGMRVGTLPDVVRESSGIARSRRDPSVWWTHNDGPDGRLFAIGLDGALLGTWRLAGERVIDVEDIASAPCPGRRSDACLYLADTGDNDRERRSYDIYVVEEPELRSEDGHPRGTLHVLARQSFDYGGESRDAEALAVLEDGSSLVITKGQLDGIEVFQLPVPKPAGPGADSGAVEAKSLGILPLDAEHKRDRVTGAALAPTGNWLAVRSDAAVTLVDWPRLEVIRRCVFSGGGKQGEAVDFVDDATIVLTFEADKSGQAPIYRVRCSPA